ncbi:NADP-dependent isocitrate dehydrogenase [Glutamicibacter arilaitensis]|uniref:NADP-dependent isocitrate dehydrogenase n=2 Tax=Glutamicibacter arilaitensis TaxID=256701 RepID=UPI003F8F9DEF
MLVPIADTGNLNQTYPHPGSFSIRNLIIESKQLIATHDKERRSMNLMRQITCFVLSDYLTDLFPILELVTSAVLRASATLNKALELLTK